MERGRGASKKPAASSQVREALAAMRARKNEQAAAAAAKAAAASSVPDSTAHESGLSEPVNQSRGRGLKPPSSSLPRGGLKPRGATASGARGTSPSSRGTSSTRRVAGAAASSSRGRVATRRAAAPASKPRGAGGGRSGGTSPSGDDDVFGSGGGGGSSWGMISFDGSGGDTAGDFGMVKVEKLIERARSVGILSLAARSMTTFPPEIFSLLPETSKYHPINTQPPESTLVTKYSIDKPTPAVVDFSDPSTHGPSWLDSTDLKTLRLENNEISEIPVEIGGFGEEPGTEGAPGGSLQILDLHNNLLYGSRESLPITMARLRWLTSLSLESNKLGQIKGKPRVKAEFPKVLLALECLIDLDLGGNGLEELWSTSTWQSDLEQVKHELVQWEQQRHGKQDGLQPHASGDTNLTSVNSEDFWSGFPSSPSKGQNPLHAGGRSASPPLSYNSNSPFSRLRSLKLGRNKLGWEALKRVGEWPPRLVKIELGTNIIGVGIRSGDVKKQEEAKQVIEMFSRLDRLTTLELRNNEINDGFFQIFKRIAEAHSGEEASSERTPFFRSLKSLDISKNLLDQLSGIEAMLAFPGFAGKQPDWQGLPSSLGKLVKFQGDQERKVEVFVEGNYLKDEAKRRRAGIPEWARGAETNEEEEGQGQEREEEIAIYRAESPVRKDRGRGEEPKMLTEGEKRLARARQEREAASKSAIAGLDPLLQSVYSAFDKRRAVLTLAGRALEILPVPPSDDFEPIEAQEVMLSKNLLSSIPFDSMAAWGWRRTLRKLDLSRNKLSAIQLSHWMIDGGGDHAVFEVLEELNLGGNALASLVKVNPDSQSAPLLALIANVAPSLISLQLTMNYLTSVDGIEGLLVPNKSNQSGRKGLKQLKLDGNRITDLGDLGTLGEAVKEVGDEKLIRDWGWGLEELDLADNDISHLPPALGFFPPPLSVVRVGGNTFRVPARRIYEKGTSELMKYLRNIT